MSILRLLVVVSSHNADAKFVVDKVRIIKFVSKTCCEECEVTRTRAMVFKKDLMSQTSGISTFYY